MRDDFPPAIKELLAKRVNYLCSNPRCRRPTIGPHVNPEKTVNVGVAAHLTAASSGGPRFDESLSAEERKSAVNGIWLCQKCAKLVDNDPVRYTLKLLLHWKQIAESTAALELEGNAINETKLNGVSSFHIPIPNLFGLDYHEAREQLIEAGWQPAIRHWSYADDIDICDGNGPIFWQQGYHEIESSSGTGYAICSFKFVDVYGNNLKIITAGEEYPDTDIKASVIRWFLESASESDRPSWPDDRGVYIADSSEMIPYFPSSLDGYRSENSKGFWDEPFSCKGTVRIFDSNGWTGIPDFPHTQNSCSAGVFMIRWRSAYPDVGIESTIAYSPDNVSEAVEIGSFGYMYGTNCEQPLFKFAGPPESSAVTLADIYYELKFWQAAP